MELAIPLVALSSLYFISRSNNTQEDSEEGFQTNNQMEMDLPNTNVPNTNYPSEIVNDEPLDVTTKLAVDNKYNGQAHTDKYYNLSDPKNIFNNEYWPMKTGMKATQDDYTSLSGNKVDLSYYTHNNMQPFFSGSVNNRNNDHSINESLLDSHVGNGSQTIDKKEQSPLFAPNENHQWAYGAPNQNDFMQSRVNPSLKMSNVLPFKQETVGPGIGLGYTSEGLGGYNSGMMERDTWMPKTVDELRTDNNPKSGGGVLLGREGPAATSVKSRGELGRMEKHGPEKTFEMNNSRYFTTTGLEKKQTLRPIQEDRYTNRQETTTDYTGAAGGDSKTTYIEGEYMPSKKHELGEVPISIASAAGRGGANENDFGAKSQMVYANNRSSNKQNDYFGAIGGAIGSVVSPLLDVVRPSRKENTVGNLRVYSNASTKVPLSYVFNPADRAPTTIRETTENTKQHLNVGNKTMNKGAYTVTKNQAANTARMGQSDYYYAGNSSASANSRKPQSYEAGYNQRNNDVRMATIDNRLEHGNMSLMNNNVNVKSTDRSENMNQNYMNVGSSYKGPSLDNMGQLQGKLELHSGIQSDRLSSQSVDIKQALKQNPYALSITK
tara:strand:+ start:3340 stop:5160 length:1821 start_codon:yes stop_codon:yes gene_type:complete